MHIETKLDITAEKQTRVSCVYAKHLSPSTNVLCCAVCLQDGQPPDDGRAEEQTQKTCKRVKEMYQKMNYIYFHILNEI